LTRDNKTKEVFRLYVPRQECNRLFSELEASSGRIGRHFITLLKEPLQERRLGSGKEEEAAKTTLDQEIESADLPTHEKPAANRALGTAPKEDLKLEPDDGLPSIKKIEERCYSEYVTDDYRHQCSAWLQQSYDGLPPEKRLLFLAKLAVVCAASSQIRVFIGNLVGDMLYKSDKSVLSKKEATVRSLQELGEDYVNLVNNPKEVREQLPKFLENVFWSLKISLEMKKGPH
jgi:hypothetical protein